MDPDFLSEHGKAGEALLKKGPLLQVEFSWGTYQVQVDGLWVFLQFDAEDRLRDSFCSCPESEETNACVHMAAAYLRVCPKGGKPLHRRFEASFWRHLLLLIAKKAHYSSKILKSVGKQRYGFTVEGEPVSFGVEGQNKPWAKRLKNLIEKREELSEETSIKFSNLSAEELELWRQRTPSERLKFELSVWSDLAKVLFLEQVDGAEYQLEFECSDEGIPVHFRAHFEGLFLEAYLDEPMLAGLVPSLETVEAPLQVHHFKGEVIDRAEYHREEGTFSIRATAEYLEWKDSKQHMQNGGPAVSLDGWWFICGDGFYPRGTEEMAEKGLISAAEVPQFLDEYGDRLNPYLGNEKVQSTPIAPQYHLEVTPKQELQISIYLFEKGDLEKGFSRYFGDWAYLEGQGFFPLTEKRFEAVVTAIPVQEVGQFVSLNRHWLNKQKGFQVHVATVETHLQYHVDEEGILCFESQVSSPIEVGESVDYGSWVYIKGQGFFGKSQTSPGHLLHGHTRIAPEHISEFIRSYRSELEHVPGFFARRSPVEPDGVRVEMRPNGSIQVVPAYKVVEGVDPDAPRYFKDFVYLPGSGFHVLPIDTRLPEEFRRPTSIPASGVVSFVKWDLDILRPYAASLDLRLQNPLQLSLKVLGGAKEGKRCRFILSYWSQQGQVPLSELLTAIRQNKPFLLSEGGCIDLQEPRFEWLRYLDPEIFPDENEALPLTLVDVLRLTAFEKIEAAGKEGQQALELLKGLAQLRSPDAPVLKGLKTKLRPYQREGLDWLWFLYRNDLAGLLCDDMGLGKTHQAMALLSAARNTMKFTRARIPPPFFIVCPTSVVHHWKEKLAEYLPTLRVFLFYGTKRSLDELNRKQYHILLTSYGVLRLEQETLRNIHFDIAIFDEVQIAKNHQSQIHQVLRSLDAHIRVGLTGTPIENRLRELKALFDVVLPNYMPSETHYREFFVNPIEKEQDPIRKDLLARYIRPFVLRRKKSEVLEDLPEKSEEVGHCDLFSEQSSLYNEVLEQTKPKLLEEMSRSSRTLPYMHIFSLLTKLKQICDHPAVYHKDPENYQRYSSGKWELFKELLKEALDSEQKVVVFTQYLAMLDILEYYCDRHGIPYAAVRGSTVNRQQQIGLFQQDPNCKLFLGSLQAVGLGVDLTAGSVVIHYDRWWNPARETQATDRVHRIGQSRGVQVFKLVTLGTIEERIDEMIRKKSRLAEDILTTDDEGLLKLLKRDEILDLFHKVRPTD